MHGHHFCNNVQRIQYLIITTKLKIKVLGDSAVVGVYFINLSYTTYATYVIVLTDNLIIVFKIILRL